MGYRGETRMSTYNEPRPGDNLTYQGKHYKVTELKREPRELTIVAETAKPTGQHHTDVAELTKITMRMADDGDEGQHTFIIQEKERRGDTLELVARR